MKKLILSVMLTAFALALHAGDAQTCADKEKAGCCAKAKAGIEAKAECPMAKQQAKATCPYAAAKKGAKEAPVKQAVLSPKAASEAGK